MIGTFNPQYAPDHRQTRILYTITAKMTGAAAATAAAVTPAFVSCGVNRVVNALDWGENGLIAYCGHRIICIYDPETAEVVGTLTGHTGQANCVKWLPRSVSGCGSAVLLSGAADNTIRVWAWHGRYSSLPWTCLAQLQGHESGVTSLALQLLPQDNALLLASTSADAHIRLWQCSLSTPTGQQGSSSSGQGLQECFGPAAWQKQQPVHVGRQIQHCVALALLPEDPGCVLMASGGTDSTVRLYVREANSRSSSCCNGSGMAIAVPDLGQQQQGAGSNNSSSSSAGPGFQLQCQLKGHENWVKGVAFQQVQETPAQPGQPGGAVSLLLASAGQDRYGRIWCISTDPNRINAAADGPVSRSSTGGAGEDFLRSLITRYAPRPHLSAGSHTYWVTLEALLIGHEDWLHSVCWRPTAAPPAAAAANGMPTDAAAAVGAGAGTDTAAAACHTPSRSEVTLLTTSQDRSMMLWVFDTPNELWVSDAAVGDAGASCLGFYGGAFNPAGDHLVAHGFTGALHLWRQQPAADGSSSSSSSSSGPRLWVPQHALGGHYGAVQDLAWGADGACLQTVAADQTARLFSGIRGHWFELARTQVHGHDFSCLASIPAPDSRSSSNGTSSTATQQMPLPPSCLMYVSGSEEKVLRVFEAPQTFTESLTAVRTLQSPAAATATAAAFAAAAAASSSSSAGGSDAAAGSVVRRGRALGASVSALGLSNKAVYVDEESGSAGFSKDDESSAGARAAVGAEAYMEGPDFVPTAVPAVVSGPPLEEHLAQNTLWPEVRKLYGHGNDVYCACASPSGRVIASACKAQSTGAAAVWVWEVSSWKALAQLPGHTLTVTQLEFSPDGTYLLSGSRDRSFSVWKVPLQYRLAGAAAAATATGSTGSAADSSAGTAAGWDLVGRLKAAHSRIIWSVSWSHDGSFFATGSRDQTVKLWALAAVGAAQQQRPVATLPPCPAGITAVALGPRHASAAAAACTAGLQEQDVHLLAVGMEDGRVAVWRLQVPAGAADAPQPADGAQQQPAVVCEQLWSSEVWQQHAAAVKRLRWAPDCVSWLCGGGAAGAGLALASCGEDNSVRLFDVVL